MVLQLTRPTTPAEPPELVEFKKKASQILWRYAERENMCGVADRALVEAGLLGRDGRGRNDVHTVPIEVSMSLPVTLILNVDPSTLYDKSPADQERLILAAFATRINVGIVAPMRPIHQVGGISVSGLPTNVVMAVTEASAIVDQVAVPRGYFGSFTSQEGRVLHFKGEERDRYAVCGASLMSRQSIVVSSRSEGRACAKCTTYTRNNPR